MRPAYCASSMLGSSITTPCTRTKRRAPARRASFRNQIVEIATENGVGAGRRPHEGSAATEAIGSRPQPPQTAAHRTSLDARAVVDHPLCGYSGGHLHQDAPEFSCQADQFHGSEPRKLCSRNPAILVPY